MRLFILTSLSILLVVGFSFKDSKKDEIQKSIQGSWELISYVNHENNEKGWKEYESNIVYQKHITDNHFSWFKYDKKNDQLLGMGGGSYIITKEGKYVENIEFFYPPGSSELGQAIPFTVEFKEGKWYHTGKAKKMELGEDGSMVRTGSIIIEEIWSPMMPISQNKYDLIGSWDLTRFREKESGPYIEYPSFTGYMKLITPTHFIWIKYDREGDQIFAAGSGPYSYDGEDYVEKLMMVFPSNSGQIGTEITFHPKISKHRWDHFGYAPVNKENAKPIFIDEVWSPHVCDTDSETRQLY